MHFQLIWLHLTLELLCAFPRGSRLRFSPRDQGVGPRLFLSPHHGACARSEEFHSSAEFLLLKKEGFGWLCLPEGCVGWEQEQHPALLCATVLEWCHNSSPCHCLLSSRRVVASPRSRRGRPRWPGVIRHPGPTSFLAVLGGGPAEFSLCQPCV